MSFNSVEALLSDRQSYVCPVMKAGDVDEDFVTQRVPRPLCLWPLGPITVTEALNLAPPERVVTL